MMTAETLTRLAAPFEERDLEFLARVVKGDQALAVPYVTAPTVMERLDAAVGFDWSFEWDVVALAEGRVAVRGRLTVAGVTRSDAGEASGEEEPVKSAVSDALKRCAVQFGIGRYLRDVTPIWAPYDSAKRRFKERPSLKSAPAPEPRGKASAPAPAPAAATCALCGDELTRARTTYCANRWGQAYCTRHEPAADPARGPGAANGSYT